MGDVRRHYEPERKVFLESVSHITWSLPPLVHFCSVSVQGRVLAKVRSVQVPADGVDFSTPEGRFFNPGHSIEVVWFLLHMCSVLPDPSLEKIALDGQQCTVILCTHTSNLVPTIQCRVVQTGESEQVIGWRAHAVLEGSLALGWDEQYGGE